MSGYAAEPALLDALSDAHVVLLSSSSASLGADGNAMGSYHLKSEQAVQASGLPWTILRPCSFQSNMLRWRDQLHAGDVVRAPFGYTPTALIDPTDIAEVAATALTQPGHAGQTYRAQRPRTAHPTRTGRAARGSAESPAHLRADSGRRGPEATAARVRGGHVRHLSRSSRARIGDAVHGGTTARTIPGTPRGLAHPPPRRALKRSRHRHRDLGAAVTRRVTGHALVARMARY
jgi:hypothetical protein